MMKVFERLIAVATDPKAYKEYVEECKEQEETRDLYKILSENPIINRAGMDKVVRYTAIYDLQDMKEIVKLLVTHKLITRIA